MSNSDIDSKDQLAGGAILTSTEKVVDGADWDRAEERRLVRKIDLRIMPIIMVVFILNFLDRGIVANARLAGLTTDLNLDSVQYSTVISILFVGYILMQVPSNMLLHSVSKPRLYIAAVTMTWGCIALLAGYTTNFAGMVVDRVFLGFVEASLYPASLYYVTRFYTPAETGFRIALINAGQYLASAFGGLMAAGILSGMQDKGGKAAWRWLFIIEGGITMAIGAMVPFILLDFPTNTTAFNDRERHIALTRLRLHSSNIAVANGEQEEEHMSAWQGLKAAITDGNVWLLAASYFLVICGLGFGAFLPTIARTLGYGTTTTLLLTAPPWGATVFFALFVSFSSDRRKERYFHIIFCWAFAILGYIMIIAAPLTNIAARYISLFFLCMALTGGVILLSWVYTTVPGHPSKRAAAFAIINGFANIGQIPSAYFYDLKFAPRYQEAFVIEIVLIVCAIAMITGLRFKLVAMNKRMDREEAENPNAPKVKRFAL